MGVKVGLHVDPGKGAVVCSDEIGDSDVGLLEILGFVDG